MTKSISTINAPNLGALDQSQRAFCTDSGNYLRLLAPAGSGKTTSLLWRCKHVSDNAANAPRFLIFTFTRAARDELRDRLRDNQSFSTIAANTEVTTLNAWGQRRLKARTHNLRLLTTREQRYFAMANSLQPLWTSYASLSEVLTDSRLKNRAARSLMDLSDSLKSLGFRHDLHVSLEDFLAHAHWLINNGLSHKVTECIAILKDLLIITETADHVEKSLEQVFRNYFEFWSKSCVLLSESSMFTLEDQKYWSLIELESAIRGGKSSTGVHRFHNVLVDEFQDINPLDLNLLKAVAVYNKCGLCVVGDDDQAIYEWRGASPEFILDPNEHISKGFNSHVLEVNYRSPKNIVQMSQRLISHNKRRVPKKIKAASTSSAAVDIVASASVEQSISEVSSRVLAFLNDASIKSIALIGRKRSQIIPYQIIFAGSDIPFYAAEDLQVFLSGAFEQLKKILLLKAQCRQQFPFGPDPIEALLSICDKVKRYPLSQSDRQHVKTHLLSGARPKTVVEALEKFYSYNGPLKGTNANGGMTGDFYVAIRDLLLAETVAAALQAISESFAGLQKDYGRSLDDIFYADPPFSYLADYAGRYGADFAKFYEDIEKAIATLALVPPADEESSDAGERRRQLHLMTALRAKGKEFDAVVILDCNQGVWPSKFAETESELEAERRLFYVAFTRVKKKSLLVVNESMLGESAIPSPYLAELGL